MTSDGSLFRRWRWLAAISRAAAFAFAGVLAFAAVVACLATALTLAGVLALAGVLVGFLGSVRLERDAGFCAGVGSIRLHRKRATH